MRVAISYGDSNVVVGVVLQSSLARGSSGRKEEQRRTEYEFSPLPLEPVATMLGE